MDKTVWRGGAPRQAGYAELSSMGIRTVVDLRADYVPPDQLALPHQAGLKVVRLPIRDGQTPTQEQVDRFIATVRAARTPVFVHCGAGVGRSGSMVAAYLVRTGQADAAEVTRRNLAIGPPTLEQIAYWRSLEGEHAKQPSLAVRGLSRLIDAPRRLRSRLR